MLGRLVAQAENYARSLPQTVRPIFGVLKPILLRSESSK
jgi:hypothetical protein